MANQRQYSYNRSSNRRNMVYVGGSVAPQYQPEPSRRQPAPRRTAEDEARMRRHRSMARRNQQREMVMNRSYVVFLAVATLVCALFCGLYINLKSSMTTNIAQVTAMQTELTSLREENDAISKELEANGENITTVKKSAKKLGLGYPKEKQLVYYSVDNSDYMNVVN